MKRISSRRKFLQNTTLIAGASAMTAPNFAFGTASRKPRENEIVGHGDFKYKVDKGWGMQKPAIIPVNDCHEMVQDSQGRLILLTNETKNNVIFYDKSGKVLKTWGNDFPGAHGLTLSNEGGEEFLFITDYERHQVVKTDLNGKVLLTLDYPKEIKAYESADQYKPTEVAVAPNGDFYVADGYGLDFITQYSPKGEYIRHWGGKAEEDENDKFNTAHGICVDLRDPQNPVLLITSRSHQRFKRFSLQGDYLETIHLPGAWICRPVIHGDELYFAVIVTKSWWAYDGCVIVLDKNNKIVSAPGGSAPTYDGDTLVEIDYDGKTFLNPHDVCIDEDKNIYVPQWYSGRTYPVKLERV